MKKTSFFVIILALSLIISGCGTNQASAPVKQALPDPNALQVGVGNFDVSIKDFAFVPADINIEKGTTVVWTNEDTAAHIVVSDDSSLATKLLSPELKTGEKYFYTFDQPGKYSYFCQIHPNMKGTITVK
jgi:plastocyanin